MTYLLDSVILIDHCNGIEPATDLPAEIGGQSCITVITRAEVLTGFWPRALPVALGLLDMFTALPITSAVADLAAELRRIRHWKPPDALQAAAAMQHGLILVTRNSRDFKPGGQPQVLIPYRV